MSGVILIGGFHELEEICALNGLNLIGAIDSVKSERSNANYLGNDDQADNILTKHPNASLHITPDKPSVRARLWDKYINGKNRKAASLIHPSATVSKNNEIGDGCVFHTGVVISCSNKIGKGVKINTGGTVTHDVIIGDFVSIAPRAVICSAVIIGDCAYIGANATIMPRVKIGNDAVVGAGAVVTRDVPDGTTVCGNPARQGPKA